METFDEHRLRRSLARLAPWKRIAFGTLVCERMLPNYDRFSAASGFGDSQVLRRGIDLVWSWLESNHVPNDIEGVCAQVEQQAPDTESFSSPFTSAALDAANAVAITLDGIRMPDGSDVVEVASLARDTIDLYVQEIEKLDPNDPSFEDTIRRHPLMQAELHRQHKDLVDLETWTGSRTDAIRRLHAKDRGIAAGSLALEDN